VCCESAVLQLPAENAVIDNFFYDTASLTIEEKAKLAPLVDREGSIIVVPPSNSNRQIRHYKSPLRFMNKEGPTICAIAVAGVGSSALGTAALARNIADALNTDVAGIVTGYGLSDVMIPRRLAAGSRSAPPTASDARWRNSSSACAQPCRQIS
jgi:hypothetical protein